MTNLSANTGVNSEGDIISRFLFFMVIDWIMRKTTEANNTRIRWIFMSQFEDLDIADATAGGH